MYKKAAGLVAKRGYRNVMTFMAGIPEWVKSGFPLETKHSLPDVKTPTLTPRELQAGLGGVTVLDIRTPSLYGMGGIAGSVRIPLSELTERYESVSNEKPLVIVDHSGKQVNVAAKFMHAKGYQVSRLQGGLMAWAKARLPLEK